MSSIASLQELLIAQLTDLYTAEKQVVRALQRLARAAQHDVLRRVFLAHLEETRGQLGKLEQAFIRLDALPRTSPSRVVAALVEESTAATALEASDAIRDAALIAAAQRTSHFEIAAHGTARALAQALGEKAVARLFQEMLEDELRFDHQLSTLAEIVYGEVNSTVEADPSLGHLRISSL